MRSEYDDVTCQGCRDVYFAMDIAIIDTLPYCPNCAAKWCERCGDILDFCEHHREMDLPRGASAPLRPLSR